MITADTSQKQGTARKGKESAYPQSGFSTSEEPSEERNSLSWESDDLLYVVQLRGMARGIMPDISPFEPCQPSDTCCSGSWLYTVDWIESGHQKTEFGPCEKSFVFANAETGTCLESCISCFLTTPPCSTIFDVLETGNMPILFSLSQMKNFGATTEVETKLHVQPLACTLLQPNVPREQFSYPKRHVTFSLLDRKNSVSSSHTRIGRR